MRYARTVGALWMCLVWGCDGSGETPDGGAADAGSVGCAAAPEGMQTADGVEFVRTPDACFEGLPDWPFAPVYVELDGLRQAYVDEGPSDGPVVLLLHGQPTWSYLYRKMIPVFAEAGYRVIAMDHLGMGRSDKPVDIAAYSYLGHGDRLWRFIEALDLQDINLFVQDWGSLIGLRVAGLHPERFARIAVGNGALPVVPEGVQPFPAVESPNEVVDLPPHFGDIPAQQVPFYDGCELLGEAEGSFGDWMTYSMKAEGFRPSEVVEALTWFDVPDAQAAAYDAPFPRREYMAGVRVFPSLVNELSGQNAEAWAGLMSFERPFITLWAANDPGSLGRCESQQRLVDAIPGAAGVPHDRLAEASHFLQDDQGEEIARRLAALFRFSPVRRGTRYCELLIVSSTSDGLLAEVWGTHGISECSDQGIASLDTTDIQAEEGALAVIINGPRVWIPNVTMSSSIGSERRTFGELEMVRLASLAVEPGMAERMPYVEQTVARSTTYRFDAGERVFELTSPGGPVYVMQSWSLEVDAELMEDDLAGLADRLTLPAGWTYASRVLTEDLVMMTDGEATVVQDDLQNTYQRRVPAD
ncbi:MAG: haloalkane dehalogenase [Sandaracinaceae bacterium]